MSELTSKSSPSESAMKASEKTSSNDDVRKTEIEHACQMVENSLNLCNPVSITDFDSRSLDSSDSEIHSVAVVKSAEVFDLGSSRLLLHIFERLYNEIINGE